MDFSEHFSEIVHRADPIEIDEIQNNNNNELDIWTGPPAEVKKHTTTQIL